MAHSKLLINVSFCLDYIPNFASAFYAEVNDLEQRSDIQIFSNTCKCYNTSTDQSEWGDQSAIVLSIILEPLQFHTLYLELLGLVPGRYLPMSNAGDVGLFPGSGRSPGEGNGYPLQYSVLENAMDRGDCGLQSMRLQWFGHDWVANTLLSFSSNSFNVLTISTAVLEHTGEFSCSHASFHLSVHISFRINSWKWNC